MFEENTDFREKELKDDDYWRKKVRGEGERLDVYLSHSELHMSRSKIKKRINRGKIIVNGMKVKPSYTVKKGDIIEAAYSPPEPFNIEPEYIPLSIIYEDDDIIVINKQANLIVHPAKGHSEHTLVNALLYHCENLPGGYGMDRPGVVHRLDTDTTGIIIFAKSERAHSDLGIQFQERSVSKTYIAIVWGKPPMKEGEINAPIGRHPVNRELMAVTPLKSKDSITHFKLLHSYHYTTVLKLMPVTGRTHQLRVHLSHYGYPIIGDYQYGGRDKNILRRIGKTYEKKFERILRIIDRQALHAASLTINHPSKGRRMSFYAPVHKDMKNLIGFFNETNSS